MALLERAKPRRRVELILYMRVAVPRPAHKSRASDHLSSRMRRDDLFTAQPVLRRDDRAPIELAAHWRDRIFHLRRFRRHDRQIARRKFLGQGSSLQSDVK